MYSKVMNELYFQKERAVAKRRHRFSKIPNIRHLFVQTRGAIASIPFEIGTRYPVLCQNRLLKTLLRNNSRTCFGIDHHFTDIRSVQQYQELVPIGDHQRHQPYIEQILEGHPNALTSEKPFMFGSTSGTTKQPKWIPITHTRYKQMSAIISIWLSRMGSANPDAFRKKVLTVVSPAVEEMTNIGIPVGSVSGLTSSRVPWLIRQTYAVPYAVSEIQDYNLRYFLIARISCGEELSLIITPNPSTLSRIAEEIHNNSQQIISAIREGTLGIDTSCVCEDQKQYIETIAKSLKPNPERAAVLQGLLDLHGRLLPQHCWPDLSVIGCWLGGSAGIHAQKLRESYGSVQLRDIGFRATEGTFSITVDDNSPDGVLAIHANFYEFIPVEDIDCAKPRVLLAHELEIHQSYYMIVTTNNGLYRYDMNDIILVTGMYNKTPVIRFLRKGRNMLNIVGEKLHVNQVLAAASFASRQTGLEWVRFRMIPDVQNSQHQFLVEFSNSSPSQEELDIFMKHFDERLCTENPEYPSKRKSGRLLAPKAIVMKRGWSKRIQQRDIQNGKREVQYKWQYMAQDWDDDSKTCIKNPSK